MKLPNKLKRQQNIILLEKRYYQYKFAYKIQVWYGLRLVLKIM